MRMKGQKLVPVLVAAALLAACGEETRNGQLTLTGAQPVRIIDQGGSPVDFVGGPIKVVFSADSSRKFTVSLEQSGRKAKFSGRVPYADDWNFTVKGGDIGQPVDFTSQRTVSLYGPVYTRWGTGGFCGFDGQWETEETWQKGNEDWKVSFADARSGAGLGAFASRVSGKDYLLSSRNVWCRERPRHEPYPGPYPRYPRWNQMSQNLSSLEKNGVSFDGR